MRVLFSIAATRVCNSTFFSTIRLESEKYQMLCDLPVSPLFDENGVQATSGRVNFILLPVPPTTIAGSGGDVFMSRHKLDTEKSVHLVTDVELAIFLYIWCNDSAVFCLSLLWDHTQFYISIDGTAANVVVIWMAAGGHNFLK